MPEYRALTKLLFYLKFGALEDFVWHFSSPKLKKIKEKRPERGESPCSGLLFAFMSSILLAFFDMRDVKTE